jgi:RHS repeat-associated protein
VQVAFRKTDAAQSPMAAGGDGYRYGYQGLSRPLCWREYAEDETEETGWNAFELRMYDSKIGRWLVTDPYNQFWSPYNGMGNNPLNGVDPDGGNFGDFFNEIGQHVGSDGINDGKVYSTTNATVAHNTADGVVDWDAIKNANSTSFLGLIGGNLDVNRIYSNLLDHNVSIATGIWDPRDFRNLVQAGGEWDYKVNTQSIFGFTTSLDSRTRFVFRGSVMEAQDIGNHHFGVVGKATGLFPEIFMLRQAGQAQINSGTSKPEWQIHSRKQVFSKTGRIIGYEKGPLLQPYGDDPRDQSWINQGFQYFKSNY